MGVQVPVRRWVFPVAALAVVLGASLAGVSVTHDAEASVRREAAPLPASPPIVTPATQPPAPAQPAPPADAAAAATAPGARTIEVRYPFDGESHSVAAAAGGKLRAEPHGAGQAVRFPPPCPTYRGNGCPRVVVQTSFATNPGTAPLRYGASVLLAPRETGDGENVLQKGFSHGHSQFKLQIDGRKGLPSCVLVGTSSSRIYVVTGAVTVADGQWHSIECSRAGTSLTITADGTVAGRARVPASLSIVNSDPLRIGGKGLSPNNDQYHGALDDVFVSIGCGEVC